MPPAKSSSSPSLPDRRPRLSRIADIDEASRRQAVRETILEAREEGRSLVVEIDGQVREVPASELLTIEEAESQNLRANPQPVPARVDREAVAAD